MHNVAHQLDTELVLDRQDRSPAILDSDPGRRVDRAALCIALAARLQTPINNYRKELQLVTHSNIYRALPPKYALATAIGGPSAALPSSFLDTTREA
jgi:hypothetical protein